MTYVVEAWDDVLLNLAISPYIAPSTPLTIELDFYSSDVIIPPLPWVLPSLTAEYSATLRRADAAMNLSVITITPANAADANSAAAWGKSTVNDHASAAAFEDAKYRDHTFENNWDLAGFNYGAAVIPWQQSGQKDQLKITHWDVAQTTDRGDFLSGWIMKTAFVDKVHRPSWYTVNLWGRVYDDTASLIELLNTETSTTITLFGDGGIVEITKADGVHFQFGYVRPDRPIVPHDLSVRVTARQASLRDNYKHIPWGNGQSVWHDYNLPYPVEENPIIIDPTDPPLRKVVYLTMNTLTITDIATGTPLDIQGVTISLDIDSLSWKFSGTVYGQATLDLVAPDNDGMKDISVTINTHQWVFAIERYTRDEKFPTQKFSISGVSRTQYMASPFAPIRSYTNAIGTTAAQAATAELDGTGFTLIWPVGDDDNLPDWGIPAGALSYRDKSPAQVIAQIVTAAGGVMIPSMAADSWTIQPRYKTSPWHWDSVAPDQAIYIGMVVGRSGQYEPGQAYDACYVSGINQGVAVEVQRLGSGGLNPMPDIFDDLITDTQPAISRGRNELAENGNKVIETLSVMIPEGGAAPGIILPGMIVSVTHDDSAKDYVALVLSTSISVQRAGAAEIFQNVTLERTA